MRICRPPNTMNSGARGASKGSGPATSLVCAAGSRSGFTLLEVLLASAIALLLLGALYISLQVELSQASAGREIVGRSTLARGLITRIEIDLTPCITPLKATPKSSAAATTTTSTTTTSSTTAPAQAAVQTSGIIPPQAGVIGTSQMLTIFTTRVPDPKLQVGKNADGTESPDAPFPSDLRRIYYWLGSNGGLCRREIPWFSQDQLQTTSDQPLFDGEDESKFLIAPEVADLQFEYYDINNTTTDDQGWTTDGTWDGSTLGSDGMTPIGPPTAIRVRFTIKSKDGFSGKESTKEYRHVIIIMTASGPSSSSGSGTNTTNGASTTTP